MSSFFIKLIAIITMLVDHSCDVFVQHYSIGYVIGRIAFPLFAFQLVVGYENTHDIKKYLKRMFIFALVSEVPYAILIYNYLHQFDLNVMFTLFFALLAMCVWDSKKIKCKNNGLTWIIKILIIALISTICEVCKMDHGAWGVITVLAIYLLYPYNLKKGKFTRKNQKISKIIVFAIAMAIVSLERFASYIPLFGWYNYALCVTFAYLPTIFMLTYNGKKGPSMQYFFYAFYPVHLAILDIIYFILYK